MSAYTAYITLAHKRDGDWEAADWTVSTGKDALETARFRAKRMIERGYELVSIREVSDDLYGGFHEEVKETTGA